MMDKYAKEWLAKEKKHQAKLNKLKLPKMAGFVESTQKSSWSAYGVTFEYTNRVLTHEEFKVKFIFKTGGNGTTEYWYEPAGKTGFWASFDRTGVEDSFYWTGWGKDAKPHTPAEMIETFKDHIERIKKQREYAKTAISVPQIGFTISPDRKEKDIAQLKAGKYVQFIPSGFGTGYTITRKPMYSYSKRAAKPLEDFYGVSPLYISTMDCD
jgi:hypothetical protein